MKKFIFISLFATCSILSQAQLKVDSNGRTQLGYNANGSTSQLNVITSGYNGIYTEVVPGATEYCSPSTIKIAATGYTSHLGVERSYGLKGTATGDGDGGRCYGVFGEAYGGTYGYNYGVFGRIPTGKLGVGVFGTSYSSLVGEILSTSYAGFFQGNVKITGTLDATLLTKGAPSLNDRNGLSSLSASSMTEHLSGLEANTFYYEMPQSSNLRNDTILEDTDVELNAEERQLYSKQHYSLDPNQLEEVFPDLVYDNSDGSKSINYVEMVPILVQAINELKSEISELRGVETKPATRSADSNTDSADKVILLSLGENKPNPFTNTTTIPVCIPESVEKAFIYVYDLTGKKVQQVDIAVRGKQSVTLGSSALTDGMYLYSLIADGKVVQTRRMIVEK